MSVTRGFYIGRFQPYHEGHHAMVERIARDVDELVIGIGSADQSHTPHDPFTAGERMMMITKATQAMDLLTYAVPIEDLNRNAVWVSHVQSMSPNFDVAYSNNPLVVRLFEEAGIEVKGSQMYRRDEFQGTEIRQRIVDGGDWQSLVPPQVVDVLHECDGVDRLRQVADTDDPATGDDLPGDTEMSDGGAEIELSEYSGLDASE
jgi:nicotinamide-nucleotide adenylyltransferase